MNKDAPSPSEALLTNRSFDDRRDAELVSVKQIDCAENWQPAKARLFGIGIYVVAEPVEATAVVLSIGNAKCGSDHPKPATPTIAPYHHLFNRPACQPARAVRPKPMIAGNFARLLCGIEHLDFVSKPSRSARNGRCAPLLEVPIPGRWSSTIPCRVDAARQCCLGGDTKTGWRPLDVSTLLRTSTERWSIDEATNRIGSLVA